MANFMYTHALKLISDGEIVFGTSSPDDFRVAIVMNLTTADTEEDKQVIGGGSGFTTLDEFDGSGYSSGGSALANETTTEDTTNDRSEFDADDLAFGNLGAGTSDITGLLVYKFVTNFASSIPVCYLDTVTGGDTSFPFPANGSPVTISWNAEGIIQFTSG